LKRILREGMGLRPNALEAAIGWVRWVRSARRSSDSPPIDVAGTQLGISAGGLAEGVAGLFIPSRRCHKTETGAPALWERLRRYSAEEQRAIVQESTEFWSPILCELLCEESVKAAADRPRRAKELAELALDIAGMVPGNESWRSFSQGYVWAFLGNVRRVQGDLQGADDAFTRSAELRRAGSSASSPEPLSEARLLDLEASLRREQRRLPEALWLLDRALAMSTDEEATARALIKKAKTLEEMDDYVGAVETLREADRILPAGDSRLFLCLRFNLLENLSQTGRFAEALPMLPGVQELAARLGNELDLVRLRWLEARLWAALGRLEEALEALRWVGSEFAARGIAYDAALVTLEAAVLLADEGRTQEVKQLARETAPIFKAQGVGREALATLRLFCQAAEAERLTGTLARHLLKELRRKGSEGGVGETNDA
jgi:tetratricopeptide (TPR) repeat protein